MLDRKKVLFNNNSVFWHALCAHNWKRQELKAGTGLHLHTCERTDTHAKSEHVAYVSLGQMLQQS